MLESCVSMTPGGPLLIELRSTDWSFLLEASGWSHVATSLHRFGFQVTFDLSVDWDANCAEAHTKSHGSQLVWGPHNFVHEDDSTLHPCFILSDIFCPAWLHYTLDTTYELMVISPPCPPWSAVNQGKGSSRQDGLYLYAAWQIIGLIKPVVVSMEMVSHLLDHVEWPYIKQFIKDKGYSIRWAQSLDLANVLPQHRDRLILIATSDDSSFALQPHHCVTWPTASVPTLRTHQIIMDMMLPWCLSVVPSAEILQMYMNPNLMPNAQHAMRKTPKRQRQDIFDYRMRDKDSSFCCILTTYGHAHELDKALIEKGGLYGSFLLDPMAIRFLQVPEVLCLFGPTNSVWLPSDPQRATRLLGNAISVPHAAIAIVNCLAFLRDVTLVETTELFAKIMGLRMHAGNLKQIEDRDGFLFYMEDDQGIPPTVPMLSFGKITITNGFEKMGLRIEYGANLHDALQILLGRKDEYHMAMQPVKQPFMKIPLPVSFVISESEMRIFVPVSFRLQIEATCFVHKSNPGSLIIALTPWEITIMKRLIDMKISDVEDVISILELRQFPLKSMDSVGLPHASDSPAAPVVICMNQSLQAGSIEAFGDVSLDLEPEGIRWQADFKQHPTNPCILSCIRSTRICASFRMASDGTDQ